MISNTHWNCNGSSGCFSYEGSEDIFLCQKLWRCGIVRVGLSLIDEEGKML